MENFLMFLKILFLGKTILLTPSPVDLSNQWLELTPNITIEAVTSGASLGIQISPNDPLLNNVKNSKDVFGKLKEAIPIGTLVAKLIDLNGHEILLSHSYFSISDFSFSREDSVRILVTSAKSIPTDLKFNKIKIMSSIEIKDVKIYWKNFKH